MLGNFYPRRFSKNRSSSGYIPSVNPSVCPFASFGVPSLCNLLLQKFSFLFIQTLQNDCSYIEDVHLLFCAHFIFFLLIFDGC